jgi:REP element-mobilizing transposase RayT
MARKVRLEYPGAIYHVVNRGDHQERIFCDDEDRQEFLATLEEACQKTTWQVHAFCLMSNHFHFVVETPAPNLVEGMTGRGELEQEFQAVRRGWCVGSEQFRADQLACVEKRRGKWHYGEELGQAAQARAECVVVTALRAAGVIEERLASWRKGHPFKVRLAARLRAETTVTVEWIAQRLRMGTRGHLAHLLHLHERSQIEPPQSGQSILNL